MSERDLRDPATLAEIGRQLVRVAHDISLPGGQNMEKVQLERKARMLLLLRQSRTKFFDADLFGEPVWDMLLDLYVAYANGNQVRTSSLCIAAGVPHSTALRYIDAMEIKGLVRRTKVDQDNRLRMISLTQPAVIALENVLSQQKSIFDF